MRVVKGYKKIFINTSGAKGIQGKQEPAAELGQGPGGTGVRRLRHQTSPPCQPQQQGWPAGTQGPAIPGSLCCDGTRSGWGTPKLHIPKCLGPDGFVADFPVRPLPTSLEWPWSLGEGPEDWRNAKCHFSVPEGQEGARELQPVILAMVTTQGGAPKVLL